MSSRIKKQRDKLAAKVIEGKISVAEAQRMAGGKYARKAAAAQLVKSQQARDSQLAETMRQAADALRSARPVGDDDILAAIRVPMPRPPLTKAAGAGQVPREDPRRAAQLLKSYKPPEAAPPPRPARWSAAELELKYRAELHHDPAEREAARKSLVAKGLMWGEAPARRGAARTIEVYAPEPGPGGHRESPPALSELPGWGFAPPGMAGR